MIFYLKGHPASPKISILNACALVKLEKYHDALRETVTAQEAAGSSTYKQTVCLKYISIS